MATVHGWCWRRFLAASLAWCALNAGAAVKFRVEVQSHTEPVTNSAGVAPAKDSRSTFDVTLGNRLLAVSSDKENTVYDFEKRIVTRVDNAAKTRMEYSLYSVVGFRDYELRNREMLGQMMAAAKINAAMYSTPGNEHNLAIQLKPSTPLQSRIENGEEIFALESREFFRRSVKSIPVSPEEARMFAQYLRYAWAGHPQILSALARGNAIPNRLVLNLDDPRPKTLTFEIGPVQATDEKPVNLTVYTLRPAEDSADPVDKILDRAAMLTTAEFLSAQKKVKDDYDRLIQSGQVLDAFLALLEFSLMTGNVPSSITPEDREKIRNNQQVQLFNAALSPGQNAQTADRSIEALTRLRALPLEKSYVLKVYEANIRAGKKEFGLARDLFLGVIATNPYVTGAYKDFGDLMYMQYDTAKAWRFWDAGRKINPTFPNLQAVRQYENHLSASYPEYF